MLTTLCAFFLMGAVRGALLTHTCTWSQGVLHVTWNAPDDFLADYYEIQIANAADANLTSVFSTAETKADLDFLLPSTIYWLRLRAHRENSPSLGPGTWGEPNAAIQCKTGQESRPRVGASSRSRSRFVEVLRQSEYTYDVDYLMNHNSGNVEGDAAFVTAFSSQPDQKGFLNTTFRWSTFTLYCVEVLSVTVPNTITTGGVDKYADYLSCDDNHNATNPLCSCDNAIDRALSKSDEQMQYCHDGSGDTCTAEHFQGCTCTCSPDSLAASAKYTGMMPVYYGQSELLGYWYSHPKATECSENEEVGQKRSDGSQCTWKRHGEARVLRGSDALEAGWNSTRPASASRHSLDPAQAAQNADVFRSVFDKRPYQKWACGEKRDLVEVIV